MLRKIAFVFPGQGSQHVGMGKEFMETVPEAVRILETGEDVTGLPLGKLCIEGPAEELTRTANLQPALTAVDMLCCQAAMNKGIEPSAVAGHSLGEYPALWCSGVLTLEDTFRLVYARASAMDKAAEANPGSMAACIGLSKSELEELVETLSENGVIALANHNSPEQIVVTGEKDLVAALCGKIKEHGARAVPLRVAGAFHSIMMKEAADRLADVLRDVRFSSPRIPLYSNVTARPETDPAKIKKLMIEQICAPVKWYDIIVNMARDGVSTFVETGPKSVLGNLIKKCIQEDSVKIFQIEDSATLENCVSNVR